MKIAGTNENRGCANNGDKETKNIHTTGNELDSVRTYGDRQGGQMLLEKDTEMENTLQELLSHFSTYFI